MFETDLLTDVVLQQKLQADVDYYFQSLQRIRPNRTKPNHKVHRPVLVGNLHTWVVHLRNS